MRLWLGCFFSAATAALEMLLLYLVVFLSYIAWWTKSHLVSLVLAAHGTIHCRLMRAWNTRNIWLLVYDYVRSTRQCEWIAWPTTTVAVNVSSTEEAANNQRISISPLSCENERNGMRKKRSENTKIASSNCVRCSVCSQVTSMC